MFTSVTLDLVLLNIAWPGLFEQHWTSASLWKFVDIGPWSWFTANKKLLKDSSCYFTDDRSVRCLNNVGDSLTTWSRYLVYAAMQNYATITPQRDRLFTKDRPSGAEVTCDVITRLTFIEGYCWPENNTTCKPRR